MDKSAISFLHRPFCDKITQKGRKSKALGRYETIGNPLALRILGGYGEPPGAPIKRRVEKLANFNTDIKKELGFGVHTMVNVAYWIPKKRASLEEVGG